MKFLDFVDWNYFASFCIMLIGLSIIILDQNLIRRLFGMSIFQSSAILLYISFGYIKNSEVPIITENSILYSNPLPHVLMLTAIVVGVATLAVGLAIAVKILEK